jgi:uncharacterized protein YktA (UPF0223 family)
VAQIERNKEERRGGNGGHAGNKNAGDSWKGFVNIELSYQQKMEAKKLFGKYDQAWTHVLGRVAEGYKLTVSYDDQHTTWNVSLTCRALADSNLGLTLTGRGGSCQAAVVSLWYKDHDLLKGVWELSAVGGRRGLEETDIE